MMQRHGDYAYAEATVSRRPAAVPRHARAGLRRDARATGEPEVDAWRRLQFGGRDGTVELPRFSTSFGAELTDALIDLGLGPAFESGGDLEELVTGAGAKGLSRVLQRARVDVDERPAPAPPPSPS